MGILEYEDSPITTDTNSLLTKVFFRMFLGLLTTAIISMFTYYSGLLEDFVARGGYVFCIIAELIVVFAFSLGFRKFSANTVTVLFYVYSALTGLTFSSLFLVYEVPSICYAFIATSAIFGVLAYIGKTTKKDLTNFGTILSVTLIIGILLSLISLVFQLDTLYIGLEWIFLFIFMGFTVYDMQKILSIQNQGVLEEEKLYVYGAMELYLDFINIFLRLVSLFAKRKD